MSMCKNLIIDAVIVKRYHLTLISKMFLQVTYIIDIQKSIFSAFFKNILNTQIA